MRIGSKHSQETKEELRRAKLGRKNPNWGHPHPPATIEKMRRSHLRENLSPETIEKMKRAQTGKHHTEETKEKLRQANLGHKLSPETRLKMSQSRLGVPRSEETKEKIRRAQLGKKKTLEMRENMRRAKMGNHLAWKGGTWHDDRGYLLIPALNHPMATRRNHIRVHRLVVESYLGRYLKKSERVHHVNKNKGDNRPENLMAFISESAHQSFEQGGKVRPEDIVFDGRSLKH